MKEQNHNIKNLILDMDGVLWHGETPVPGLVPFFDTLRQQSLGFVLATNNATKTADQYVEKLKGFGPEVTPSQILTSSQATAHYLRQQYPAGSRAYIVGEIGLHDAMKRQEFFILEADGFVGADARAEVVVVGMTREFNYLQLASAAYLINNGAQFVGTNPDTTFPTEIGPLPGAGSILAFLETATLKPPLVIGKPNKGMFEEALRRIGGTMADTVMVGDRLNTDIAGGHRAGLRTILLLSGITRSEDLAESPIQPDWIFADLASLTSFLRQADERTFGLGDSLP